MAVEDTSESENERKCFGVYIFFHQGCVCKLTVGAMKHPQSWSTLFTEVSQSSQSSPTQLVLLANFLRAFPSLPSRESSLMELQAGCHVHPQVMGILGI